MKRLACALLFALLCSGLPMPDDALAKEESSAPPTRADVAEKKEDLQELRGQIKSLRKGVVAAEGKRSDVADQLKDVEQKISATLHDLRNLTTLRVKQQAVLDDLASQARELENHLDGQQVQLGKLVYRQYLLGRPDSLRLLLNGDDPNQMARDLHYLAIIGRARGQLLNEIESSLQRKQALATETRKRTEEMVTIEARQKEQHGKLVAQREQRQVVLDSISKDIAQQKRKIGDLQRDEKQLSSLISRLATKLVAKPTPTKPPAKGISNESTPEATPAGNFAQLKGALRLPVRGVVSNRFGGPRQEGSTWKGLFIRSGQGSDVKAIAAGRVVFADWMRGFGNLMIIDHGSSYLSIYGNNDALLKQVGDNIQGGATIAAVGNSGGNPESGLYFELRHDGQPLDPLKWVNLK